MMLACTDEQQEFSQVSPEGIQISDVKDLFDHSSLAGREERNFDLIWDLALSKNFSEGEVVFFPLEDEVDMKVTSGDSTIISDVTATAFAMAYLEADSLVLEIVQPVATSSTPQFTGYWHVMRWGTETSYAVPFENGEIQEVNEDHGRLDCVTTHYFYCTELALDGIPDPCSYEGSSVQCTFVSDAPMINTLAMAPGDYGTGGGSTAAELCEHPYVPGLMVPCRSIVCLDGYTADGQERCVATCPPSQELVNGNCTPVCPQNHSRNRSGACTAIEPCTTEDAVVNAFQDYFEELWEKSGVKSDQTPMDARVEQGGWVIESNGTYSFEPFPSSWKRTPCAILLPANINIPENAVGWIHTHPFYFGEDATEICKMNDEDKNLIYEGTPSNDDLRLLRLIVNHIPTFKLYVIDGDNLLVSDINTVILGRKRPEKFNRCGY